MVPNRNIFYCFLLMLVGSLYACKVGQNYSRPALNLPQEYRNAPTSVDSTMGNIPWKEFFTDPTLQQIIDSAIARNFDMQFAVKNIESAQQILRQARLGQWPDINFQMTVGSNPPSDNSLNGITA